MNPLDVAGVIASATANATTTAQNVAGFVGEWTPNAVFGRLNLTLAALQTNIAKGAKDAAIVIGLIVVIAICLYVILRSED